MDKNSDIPIIYENDTVLVLNKPPGITVNKSDTTQHEVTVQDWTEKYLKIQSPPRNASSLLDYTSDEYFKQSFLERGGIVHRLDKETSGVLIIAKNWESFKELQRQFKERLVKKTYAAFVHGKLRPIVGIVDVPVDRLPWNRRQFGIVAGGRPSETTYVVMHDYQAISKEGEEFSLVELTPKTGRTHQIRVHMKYLNHPIFSDFLYGGRKVSARDRKLLGRVFLHAAKIIFADPVSGKEILSESPLPKELNDFLDQNFTLIS